MGSNPGIKDAIMQAFKEWEAAHAWPPEVHFNRFHVPPSGWEYIGPDDELQINIYTTSSTTGLTLALRQLTSDGRAHYMQESLDGVSTSTLTTKRFKLAEGWLIGACVSNLGGGLADQVCWVSMALQRGVKSNTVPHTILQQGFVTNLISVSWPPTFSRGPATGSGVPTLTEWESRQGAGSNVVLSGTNQVRIGFINFPSNIKFSNFGVVVNVIDAVGLYSFGLYDLSGNLLATTAPATLPTLGFVSFAFTGAPITLAAGNYLLAWTGTAVTAALGATTTTGGATALASTASTTPSSGGALPATIAVPATTGSRSSFQLISCTLF